ncbi:GTP-Rho binding exocyst subunit [Saccharomycopsis crataegensis]|uniref:Exocyst complex protein EXO70 n=1 Tax=Saccharomycopsis crataegensis TaxID=43959 RepID=A0AAV5QVX9_9ASCO|nr:GTP-Rho binding exocyst subunit [Saccharomycopsis crataegensis]
MIVDVDEADVAILEENLNKSRALISSVNLGLKKIAHTSQRSETLIKPMIDNSRRLEIYQRNIKECLKLVDKVKDSASTVAQYEAVLENVSVLENNLPKYIQCLKDSKKVLSDMRMLKIDEFRGVFDNIVKVIKNGEAKLLIFAKNSIIKYSKPFDPTQVMTENLPFPVLDDNVINKMMMIVQYFADFKKIGGKAGSVDDFLEIENIYIEQRRIYVSESLGFLEASTKPLSKGANVPYEKNSNGINHYTDALIQFMLTENDLIIKIFSNIKYTDQKLKNVVLNAAKKLRIFEKLFSTIFSTFVNIVQQIIDFINKNYGTEGVLSFELVQCYLKVSPALDKVNATASNNQSVKRLESIFDNIKSISGNLFREYLKFIDTRISNIITMPSDNGVSECTVELISRMRKFSEYRQASLSIVGDMKPGTWIPSPKPQWLGVFSSINTSTPIDENNKEFLLSSYFSDCIDAIMISLEIKAKVLLPKKTSTIGYFLMTNLTLIEQVMKKSEIYSILGTAGNERLEKLRKRALNMFLTSWKGLASTLMDVTVITGGNNGTNKKTKISSKDKDAIKDKWKTFNNEFDELVKGFKAYGIKDQQLKQYLVKEISFVIPLYNRFYEKYANGEFTKHSSKYIKYDKGKLASIIQTL